jgi:hypothetical protein
MKAFKNVSLIVFGTKILPSGVPKSPELIMMNVGSSSSSESSSTWRMEVTFGRGDELEFPWLDGVYYFCRYTSSEAFGCSECLSLANSSLLPIVVLSPCLFADPG